MHKIAKQSMVFFLIATLVLVPMGASVLAREGSLDEKNTAGAMTADLVIVRPLGIVATVLGCAVFVVSLPFSALGSNTKEASQRLVKDPAQFTFKRPLGDF
jgi:hypothetical protein